MTLAVKMVLPCTLAHSVNLQTYLLLCSLGGTFAAFAHIFPSEAGMEASRGSIARAVGEKGPIPHYRYYTSLADCSRFLALFAQNGEPLHRLTFSTLTLWDFCITVELLAFATFRRKKITNDPGGRATGTFATDQGIRNLEFWKSGT